MRGNIYSSDGFTLAISKKLYKVSVNPKSIDPNKKDLFINLFSIYSGIPKQIISNKLQSEGYTTISYNIPTTTASNLRLLNSKLDRYKVFQEYEEQGRIIQKMGISIEMSGYNRQHPYKDILEPLLGYTQKIEKDKITKAQGVNGIEKSGDKYLSAKKSGEMSGSRDVGFNIIRNKSLEKNDKQDGLDITLTIPLSLQKKLETMLDTQNQKIQAKEIVLGIMDSESGKILALATSKRFDPQNIKKEDYPALSVSATELSFEPGSIIKPVIYAILLQNHLIKNDVIIDLNNGVYRLGKHIVRDDHPLKSATPREIFIHSSNIGMIKLSANLAPQIFLNALKDYGFGSKTLIDLPQEAQGVLPDLKKMRGSYRASISYGYGFRATFIQLLRAYATFSNGGYLINPRLIDFLSDSQGERYRIKAPQPPQIISRDNAKEVQTILEETIKLGTGKRAFVEGVRVGGKTGTARFVVDGKYTKRYNSSFFGFASDGKKAYTIGVVVFDPNVDEGYYGSKTAAPVFKKAVELLIEGKFLKKQIPQPIIQENKETQENKENSHNNQEDVAGREGFEPPEV